MSTASREPAVRPKPPAAFMRAVSDLQGRLRGYIISLVLDRNAADDLLQQPNLVLCEKAAEFEAGTNFKAWFLKILTNCYYSKRRREKSRPVTSDLDDTPDLYLYARSGEAGFPVQGPDPAAQLLDALGTERIVQAIGRLPDEYRVVSTLFFMDDLSYEEIARMLECPVGTVRSRLHRGRKMLQKALWQIAQEDGIVGAPLAAVHA